MLFVNLKTLTTNQIAVNNMALITTNFTPLNSELLVIISPNIPTPITPPIWRAHENNAEAELAPSLEAYEKMRLAIPGIANDVPPPNNIIGINN